MPLMDGKSLMYMSGKLETPFRILVGGSTDCGKTYYIINYVLKNHMGEFDYIVVICPTIGRNKTYDRLPKDPHIFRIECEVSRLDANIKAVKRIFGGDGKGKTLIIVDDCASGLDIKRQSSEMTNVAFHGRHSGLSIIVVSQQVKSVAKSVRDNIDRLVLFRNPSLKDMKVVKDDYLEDISDEEFLAMYKKLQKIKYARLIINLRHPGGHIIDYD